MKTPNRVIWGVMALIVAASIATVLVFAVFYKPSQHKPLVNQSLLAANNPLTLNQFTSTYLNGGNSLWTLQMSGTTLQYIWSLQAFGATPKVVWDSVNYNCGPNAANFAAMQTYLTTGGNNGTVYNTNQGYALSMGSTPTFVNPQNGQLVQFQMVMYAGDIRINSLNSSGAYWSIFTQVPTINKLTNWPTTIENGFTTLVWQSINGNGGNPNVYFTASGQLMVATNDLTIIYWIASAFVPPICP
jgi:hypothetical protein